MIRVRLLVMATAVSLGIVTSTACAATAKSPPKLLVASAVFPGVDAPQTVAYDLRRFLSGRNARFERAPSPGTVDLLVPGFRIGRRHGHEVRRPVQPCARVSIRASLHPEAADALAVARQLVPEATEEWYEQTAGGTALLGVGDVSTIDVWRSSMLRTSKEASGATHVQSWNANGLRGLSAATVQTTYLRPLQRCVRGSYETLPEELLDAIRRTTTL